MANIAVRIFQVLHNHRNKVLSYIRSYMKSTGSSIEACEIKLLVGTILTHKRSTDWAIKFPSIIMKCDFTKSSDRFSGEKFYISSLSRIVKRRVKQQNLNSIKRIAFTSRVYYRF